MTIHSSWNPRLKSVKFEFDNAPQASTDGQQHSHGVAFDIPGVPGRFVYEPAQPTGPRRPSPQAWAGTNARQQGGPSHRGHDSVARSSSRLGASDAVHSRRRRLVGESCDIGSLAAKFDTDLVALISTAWAIVLSHQVDISPAEFGLSLSDDCPILYPIRTSLDRRRPISDALRDAAAYIEQIRSSTPNTDSSGQATHDGNRSFAFRSVLDVHARGARLHEVMPLNHPLVIGCSVDQDEQEVTFSALFDERLVQRNLLRFLLGDLEHVVWQMLQPSVANLALKDLETVGPVSQRAIRRLNRP